MPPRSRAFSALAAAASLAATAGPSALATQPIYLQYDGFIRIDGGGYVLSFGYFNLTNEDRTVAPGGANAFSPAPADRNQPVRFAKGRHRFACVIVVDGSFDGSLQWTVSSGGRTSTTTAKTLDPLYELELNSARNVLHGLDTAVAAKNVCLNRPPIVSIVTSPFAVAATDRVELSAKAGQELAIAGRVEDDGLPRGGSVTATWTPLSGPGAVTFSTTTTATTRVTFSTAGVYELELSASDGDLHSALAVTVKVF